MALVSVIIPTFNREHCVRQSLDSVLAQTFKDFEVIVVDDGSTDGTVEILKSYGGKIRLICQKNAGAAAARNTGIRAAEGKWIAFLDSDDRWLPEKLETQVKFTGKYGAKVCYSRCVTDRGEPLRDIEDVTSTLKEAGVHHVADPVEFFSRARCHPYLQSMLLEKELIDSVGLFDESFHAGEDTLWILALSYRGDCLYIDRPMTVIVQGSDNSLSFDVRPASIERRVDAYVRMQSQIYGRLRQTHPQQSRLTRGRLGYHLTCRAELASAAGDFPLARSLARNALWFATDFRLFSHAVTLALAPALVRRHFRKKWHLK